MYKRMMALVLAVLMIVSLLPAPTFAEGESVCNCPAGHDTSSGHVATCPSYVCPDCGTAPWHEVCPVSDQHPMIGEMVEISPATSVYYHTPGGTYSFVNVIYFADRMEIVAVEEVNGTTYYQLNAAAGYAWKADSQGHVELFDGIWVKAANTIHLVYCEVCQKYNCGEDHSATEPTLPPVDGGVSGMIKDANGEPVLDANGDPLIITVIGDLPEGAVVTASMYDVGDLGMGKGIFDIKIVVDGEAWQPIDEGKTVVVTIPVNTDAEYVDVYHFIDHGAVLANNTAIRYYEVAKMEAELAMQLADAVDVSPYEGFVPAMVTFESKVTSNCIEIDSFSVYYYTDEKYDPANGNSSTSRISFSVLSSEDGQYYFVTRGTTIYGDLGIIGGVGSLLGVKVNCDTNVYDVDNDSWKTVTIQVKNSEDATVYKNFPITFETLKKVTVNIIIMPELTLAFQDSDGNQIIESKPGIFMGNTDDTPSSNSQANEWIAAGKYPALNYTLPEVPERLGYTVDKNNAWYLGHDASRTFAVDQEIKLSITTLQVYEQDLKDDAACTVVLVANYKPIPYTITYDPNGGSVPGDIQQLYTIEDVFGLPVPTKEGHNFLGWKVVSTTNSEKWQGTFTSAQTLQNMTGDVRLEAQWEVATGIPYTVEHYFQNVSRNGYEKLYTDTLRGAYGAETNAKSVIRSVPGFTAQNVVEGTVTADGLAVVKIYYDRNKVTISFNTNGGTAVGSKEGYYGQPVSAPTPPTKTNYIFVGWYAPSAPDSTYVFDTFPASNLELVAKWNVRESVIHFMDVTNGGEGVELGVLNGKSGENITLPTFNKTGYTLDGWYSDKECTTKVSYSKIPDQDTTIVYCKWVPNQYTITWISNGVKVGSSTVTYNTIPNVVAPDPGTKVGYSFVGWDRAMPETMPAEDIVINAVWNPRYYMIAWVNGFGDTILQKFYPYESAVDAEYPEHQTRIGYTFIGWDREIPSVMPAEDVVITATWEADRYTITYILTDANGVTGTNHAGNPATYTIESGEILLKDPTPPANYKFVGWAEGSSIAAGSTGNRTFTAIWELDIAGYAVEIYVMDLDGNYDLESRDAKTAVIGSTVSVTAESREGFVVAAESILEAQVLSDGSTTLKIYYGRAVYDIHFNTDGGSDIGDMEAAFGTTVTLPDVPVKDGYLFEYWYCDVDGNGEISQQERFEAGSTYEVSVKDVTFVAKWLDDRLNPVYQVKIGINMSFYMPDQNFYYSIPVEPVSDYVDTKCIRAYFDVTEQIWKLELGSWDQALPGDPADYIQEAFFDPNAAVFEGNYDQYFKTNADTLCIYDPTGAVTLDLLKFTEEDYANIIAAWTDEAYRGYLQSMYQVTLDWDNINAENHEVIPYVIKHKTTNNVTTWFIDVVIRPKQTYQLTYDLDLREGYSATTPVDDNLYGAGYPVILAKQGNVYNANDDGYVARYLGWHYDANGNGRVDNGELYTSGDDFVMPEGNVTLRAQWDYPVDYQVVYQKKLPAGGYITVSVENRIGYVGDTAPITQNYTGYALAEVLNATVTGKNHQVTVQYDPITYKMVFHGKNGELSDQILTYDTEASLALHGFTTPGFAFVEWKDASGTVYQNGGSVLNLADTQDAQVHLYAQYRAITLTISQTISNTGCSCVYQVLDGQGRVVTTVVITGNGSVVIERIPVGTYTIQEIGNWSWTYEGSKRLSVEVTAEGATATFAYNNETARWLHDEARN